MSFQSITAGAKARLARIHAHIGNARRDFLHKVPTAVSQNHALVYVENLQLWNMSKPAAGALKHPGKNVQAKSGLNQSILNQNWFEFRRQLEYKLAWRLACGGAAAEHEPHLPALWSYVGGQPKDASQVRVCGMW